MAEQVLNTYRAELGAALPAERFRAEATRGVLATVRRALEQGAWVSTAADQFARELAEQQVVLDNAADRTLDTLTGRHAREPFEVDAGDRRARFAD